MIWVSRAILIIFFSLLGTLSKGQNISIFPNLNEARSGFLKPFKIPSLKDYQKFSKNYKKHIAQLNRRSEKAYRKSFLKFIEIEDELLYTLCDSNEFKANALMRSGMASFGKLEHDRQRYGLSRQPINHKVESVKAVAQISHSLVPGLETDDVNEAENKKRETTAKYGSELYADYMRKRIFLYNKTFDDGTKKQKKLYRKLKKRAQIWDAFKSEDLKLTSEFANKNSDVMRIMKATPEYNQSMKSVMPDYSGTQADQNFNPSEMELSSLLKNFKEDLASTGMLPKEQIEGAESISALFKDLKAARDTLPDSLKVELPQAENINKTQTKSFWDRLYGGVDFNWQNSTGYYPDGLGVTLTGGYKITDNSGLNIELNTLFNGSEMGFTEDLRFKEKLISNYTIGANIDHKIWNFIYGGIGAEAIINNLEAPASQFFNEIQNTKYTMGIPVILRLLLPVAAAGTTNIELRYDLNSQNNIKPTFDFKVGYLIGR